MKSQLTAATQSQLDYRYFSQVRRLSLWIGASVLTPIAASFYFDFRLGVMLALAGFFVVGVKWVEFEDDGRKPLDGEACQHMLNLTKEYKDVDQFVHQIQAQGRPVVWYDLWTVSSWMYKNSCEAQRMACRQLNGIA